MVRLGDRADQKPRGAAGERFDTGPSGGQKYPRISFSCNGFCGFDVRGNDDGSPGVPRRTGQHQVRQLELAACLRGVCGHSRRERVGGVDDGVDIFFLQPAFEPVDAAESADAHRADR